MEIISPPAHYNNDIFCSKRAYSSGSITFYPTKQNNEIIILQNINRSRYAMLTICFQAIILLERSCFK